MRASAFCLAVLLLPLSACVVKPQQQASAPAAPPATAMAASSEVASADTSANGGDDEVQCKTVYSTGSRLDKRKVCTTRAERERAAANAKDFLDNSSRGSQVISGP